MVGPAQGDDLVGAQLSSQATRLAQSVSLATFVDRALLRKARIAIPDAGPEIEAELYFSEVVQQRSPTGLVLHPAAANALRQDLADDPAQLEKAWSLTHARHPHLSALLALEERLNWLALTHDHDAMRAELRSLVANLIDPERAGLAQWAIDAVERMPPEVREFEEFKMLALGAALRTGASERKLDGLTDERAQDWLEWLAPRAAQTRRVGVALVEGGLEFGPSTLPRYRHHIDVPIGGSTLITVRTEGGRTMFLTLRPGEKRSLKTMSPSLTITNAHGERWNVVSVRGTKFIKRQRMPRVHIAYDVEYGGAKRSVELPFVIGVLADLKGHGQTYPIEKRRFYDVDLERFDPLMREFAPSVEIKLDRENERQAVQTLRFLRRDDFRPDSFLKQIPQAATLLEERAHLNEAMVFTDGRKAGEEFLSFLFRRVDPAWVGNLEERAQRLAFEPEYTNTQTVAPRLAQFEKLIEGKAGEAPSSKEADAWADQIARLLVDAFQPRSQERATALARAVKASLICARRMERVFEPSSNPYAVSDFLGQMIDQIDAELSAIAQRVLENPQFQELERAWLGLWFLVSQTETGGDLKIRVLDIGKQELATKEAKSPLEDSPLYRKTYEEPFGALGGEPFSVLVGDYAFDHGDTDMDALESLVRIGARAHAPVLAAAGAPLLNMEDWTEIADPRDLGKRFATIEHRRWNAFRENEESRFVALCLPRMLGRSLYGEERERDPIEGFRFEEKPSGHSGYCWINAAYGMAMRIAVAHREYGWPVRFRGVESGGTIVDLPTASFPTDDGSTDQKCPTEIGISDRREAELSELGLLPLIHRKGTDHATFIGAQAVHKPARYDDPNASANAKLAARLPYLLPMCRFVHYLKCMARDTVGVGMTAEQLGRSFEDWLLGYVNANPSSANEQTLANLPISNCKIDIQETSPSGWALYRLLLVPQYQLEGMDVSVSTSFEVPLDNLD